MKLTPDEERICAEYSKRDSNGKVHCFECPLKIGNPDNWDFRCRKNSVYNPETDDAKYYLHYTVDFEGGIYADNQENVEAAYFHRCKDGDKVAAVFEKQWRAGGSETYRIYLDR